MNNELQNESDKIEEEEFNDSIYEDLTAKMLDEINTLPKYMSKSRLRISQDLLRIIPKLLRRIYYLKRQIRNDS